ncbi:fungal-specific transcription factor domain-containing protein [Bombardia bombarda]|uniref:Fungal-specific transcription factor domain-containing protein n=1 Tax=Bombardia bombarda TaxID=252184 RepID=A0AA39X731_9PEZI|nr:fungal-specific transcription factor domain-containing protein [Bombardia bombarda]
MEENVQVKDQQCWECRRRRVVCDSTHPVCRKCSTAGIVCPGYTDKKPLKWLAPGQVVSRAQKQRCRRPRVKRIKSRKSETESNDTSNPDDGVLVSAASTSPRLPAVQLRHESVDIIDAATYYNDQIYPQHCSNQLEPSPFVIVLPDLSLLPVALTHTLVSVAISHRLFKTTGVVAKDSSLSDPDMWSRLYHHRDIAIRSLNELIGSEKTRCSDVTISCVYSFLFAVLQQSMTPRWRQHVDGFVKMIMLRGGFVALLRSSPYMQLPVLGFWVVGVLANTTSPANDQIEVCLQPDTAQVLLRLYNKLHYPSMHCPTTLFADITAINNLRHQATKRSRAVTVVSDPDSIDEFEPDQDLLDLKSRAKTLLHQIERFSPDDWADTKNPLFPEIFCLIGRIFHSTVALYCILSLQSVSLLPSTTPEIEVIRARHARILFVAMEKGLAVPQVRSCMTWPMVVAGVEAARAGAGVRTFIVRELEAMGREQGRSSSLVAKGLLERFWAGDGRGGKGRWDECFDVPYALVL